MRDNPVCDWCGQCGCCPGHECEACVAGVGTPVEWLERQYDFLDKRLRRLDLGEGLIRVGIPVMGDTGMMFSLKTDQEELYSSDVPPVPGRPLDSASHPHP